MLCQNNGGCNHAKVIQDFIHWFSIDWPVLFSLRDQVYLNYVSVFYSCKEEKYKCCHSSVLTLIDPCYTKLLTRVNLCQTEEWEETQATGYLSLYKSSSSFSELHKAPTSYERVRHAARLRLREQEGGQLRGLVRESVRCDELPGGSQTGTHSGETEVIIVTQWGSLCDDAGHTPQQDPAQVLGGKTEGYQEARSWGGSTCRGQWRRTRRQAGAFQVLALCLH